MLDVIQSLEILPSRPIVGVYLLMRGDEIVYVGKSVHAISRVCSHRARIDFTEARVIRCFESQLDELERKLIAKFQPLHNLQIFSNTTNKVNSYRLFLTDEVIQQQPFTSVGQQQYLWDTKLRGFYALIGRRTKSYMLQRDIRDARFKRGRKTIRRLVGYACGPRRIDVEEARKEAVRMIDQQQWNRKVWNPST